MGAKEAYRAAYAVVRVDAPPSSEARIEFNNWITVKKIVWSQSEAEKEVQRLNTVNADKGCVYFWQTTRVDMSATT